MAAVLLIDDDMEFGETLALGLRSQGFDVMRSATGEGGAEAAARDHPALILLDLGLPSMDGMSVLRYVRGWSSAPVIVISARGDESSKVAALQAGADDYVTKPFGIAELVARMHAALRRSVRPDGKRIIEAGSLRIDLEGQTVSKSGADVRLTATEWRLLQTLVGHQGEVVEHGDLLRAAWGPGAATSVEYLRVYMAALRRKLEDDTKSPRHLLTQPGLGYRFES